MAGQGLAQRAWYSLLKPHLNLRAPKQLEIVDWRLGLLLRLLQGGVGLYLLQSILYHQTYLQQEIPVGISSTKAVGDIGDFSMPGFCNALEQYEFAYDVDASYRMQDCAEGEVGELVQRSPGSVFFGTLNQQKLIARASAPPDADHTCADVFSAPDSCVPTAVSDDPSHVATVNDLLANPVVSTPGEDKSVFRRTSAIDGSLSSSNGTCACSVQRKQLLVGADSIQLSLDHMFSTVTGLDAGSLPKTFVRKFGSDENKAVFEAGNHVEGSLATWLQWAEVDLDKAIDELPNSQWVTAETLEQAKEIKEGGFDPEKHLTTSTQGEEGTIRGEFPRVRVSGAFLKVSLEYYNYRMAPGFEATRRLWGNADADTICVLTIHPYMLWTSGTPESIYLGSGGSYRQVAMETSRNGVLMTFEAGGFLYGFTVGTVLSVLIEGAVLLQVCGLLMVGVARFCMGDKSRFYNEMIIERVNATAEYARFAARAMVASAFFDIIDADKSGEIAKHEIFQKLRKVTLSQGVSVEETGSLVEFMMEVADTGEDEDNEWEKLMHLFDGEEDQSPSSKANNSRSFFFGAFGGAGKSIFGGAGKSIFGGKSIFARGSFLGWGKKTNIGEEDEEGRSKGSWKEKRVKKKKRMSVYETSTNTQDAKEKRRKSIKLVEEGEEAERGTVNREEWVNIFTGPPCNVDSCIKLVQRKNAQGRYLVSEEDKELMHSIDRDIREQLAKEKQEGPGAVSQSDQEKRAHELAREALEASRHHGSVLEHLSKELKALANESAKQVMQRHVMELLQEHVKDLQRQLRGMRDRTDGPANDGGDTDSVQSEGPEVGSVLDQSQLEGEKAIDVSSLLDQSALYFSKFFTGNKQSPPAEPDRDSPTHRSNATKRLNPLMEDQPYQDALDEEGMDAGRWQSMKDRARRGNGGVKDPKPRRDSVRPDQSTRAEHGKPRRASLPPRVLNPLAEDELYESADGSYSPEEHPGRRGERERAGREGPRGPHPSRPMSDRTSPPRDDRRMAPQQEPPRAQRHDRRMSWTPGQKDPGTPPHSTAPPEPHRHSLHPHAHTTSNTPNRSPYRSAPGGPEDDRRYDQPPQHRLSRSVQQSPSRLREADSRLPRTPEGSSPRGGSPRGGSPRGGSPRGGSPRGGSPRARDGQHRMGGAGPPAARRSERAPHRLAGRAPDQRPVYGHGGRQESVPTHGRADSLDSRDFDEFNSVDTSMVSGSSWHGEDPRRDDDASDSGFVSASSAGTSRFYRSPYQGRYVRDNRDY